MHVVHCFKFHDLQLCGRVLVRSGGLGSYPRDWPTAGSSAPLKALVFPSQTLDGGNASSLKNMSKNRVNAEQSIYCHGHTAGTSPVSARLPQGRLMRQRGFKWFGCGISRSIKVPEDGLREAFLGGFREGPSGPRPPNDQEIEQACETHAHINRSELIRKSTL